jgi:hypothetical protein
MDMPNERPWAPVDVCTLPTAEQPLRVAEWDNLFATALRTVERGSTCARLVLSGDDGLVARVQRLADAETACCSFFTFTITPLDDAGVELGIEVPPSRADVLPALLDRARP